MANNADNQGIDSKLLAWAAARAASRPELLSNVIDRYLELNGMTEDDLCALLRCDRVTLSHLRLCGRPDPEPSAFAIDIQRVASKLGLDAGTLASIVREVDASEAFSRADQNPPRPIGRTMAPFSSTPGMLRAARDRDEPVADKNGEPAGEQDGSEETETPPGGPDGGEPGSNS